MRAPARSAPCNEERWHGMPKTSQTTSGDGVWAVMLVFQILEVLARDQRAWRVTDLAAELGTSKARIFRYLQTLRNLGYVVQEADSERYRVGLRLAFLGNSAAMSFDIISVCRPILYRVRDRLGLAVIASKLEQGQLHIIDKVDGLSNLSVKAVIGATLDLHCTAQGKLMLAFGPPDLLERTLASELPALTASSITDPARLRLQIDRVRLQGWATAASETVTGLNVLAVPVFDPTGEAVAVIGALGSVDEIGPEPAPAQLGELQSAAAEISRQLYGKG